MPTPNQPAQPETAPATAHTPTAELWVTSHETGKDFFIKCGDHLALHIEAMEMVAAGRDAWVKLTAKVSLPSKESLPALLAERDRLRDALEIAVDALKDSERVLANIEARKFGDIESGECHELFNSTNTEAGDEAGCIRRKLGDISEALANTTLSESARLREINEELVTNLADCLESMRVMIPAFRLKPEDNETYTQATAVLAKAKV